MRRLLFIIGLILATATSVRANQAAQGWCESGAQVVITSGLQSTTNVQASFPQCTITVFNRGTTNLATVYQDNNNTPLANPFTASTNGQWQFYAPNGRYDVKMSGAGFPNPVTYTDIQLNDPVGVAGGIVFGVYQNVPFSATPVFNAGTGSIFTITLTGSVTSSTVTNPLQVGQVIEIYICQDGVGNRTFAFPSNFSNTSFFTLSTGGNTCTPTTWFFNGSVWQPFSGGGGITTVLPPSLGGTGTGTPSAHGVAIGEGASTPFNFVVPTNNAQCLMSAASNFATTDPSFQTCPGSSGGTSAGTLGQFQEAGAVAGSFIVAPLTDIGGLGLVVSNSADFEFCGGPNPWVDVRCYARQVSSSSTMVTAGGVTATCTSGMATVSLSIVSDFKNGDGVTIYHCGANNSSTTPSAPTVVPSGSAGGTNTRIVKPSVSPTQGTTTYTYRAVGVTRGYGYSAPSAVTTITTGEASLGTQTATILTITAVGNIATATTSSAHTISPGYEVNINGTADANGNGLDGTFGGNYSVIAVPANNQFTFQIRQDVRSGGIATATGGTATWTNVNHLGVTASGGYDYYVLYDSTANRIACLTEPVNASLAGDQTYLVCDDHGSTLGGNFGVPEWLSATVPAGATNDSLTTTISSGAGSTTLTLAASAIASGTNTIHYDGGPNYIAAANAANAIGAPLYFSITSGTNAWFNFSYVTWPPNTKILQAGLVQLNGTWNVVSAKYWRGVDGAPCIHPQFGLLCAPEVLVGAAYPGVYGTSQFDMDKLSLASGTTNDPIPLVLIDFLNDSKLSNLNFAGSNSASEYLFMPLELRGHHNNGASSFANVLTNLAFNGGPSPTQYSITSTPFFYCNVCGTTTLDHVSTGLRGTVIRAPDSGTQMSVHFYYNQGGLNPAIRTVAADSGSANVVLNLDNCTQDTTAMPIVSALLQAATSVNLVNCNIPSARSGGIPPLVTGDIMQFTVTNPATPNQVVAANTNACSNVSIWDPTFNAVFTNTTENVCNFGSQLNLTPGYALYASDINVTAPTCSVASAGPPFTAAGTYVFQSAATWFNGKLGQISPNSNSCTANGFSQQITVTMPAVPSGAKGWAVFANGAHVGSSYPSTTTTTYLFTLTTGGGAPIAPSGGPAGIQNSAAFPGAVWGNFYPNSPNNTQNALPSFDVNGKLIATPCVPVTAGSICYWNGTQWTLFAGNNSGTQALTENASGVLAWGTAGAPFPPAGVPNSSGTAWLASYAAPTGNLVGTGQSNTFTAGIQDFTIVSEFRPKAGTMASIPATCTVGDVFLATDATAGQNWYFCTATNVWTQQLNSGANSPGGLVNALQYQGTPAGTFAGVNSPTVNGTYLCGYIIVSSTSVPPTCNLPGVPIDASNPATALYSDRFSYINWTSGATLTIPALTSQFGSNYGFVVQNTSSGALALTPTTPNNIDGGTGQAASSVPKFGAAFVYSDTAGPNLFTIKFPTFAAFVNCVGAGNALQFTASTGLFNCGSSSSGVSAVSGDGALISNSSSTGAVTLTLGTAGADKVWANCTGSTATPTYCSIVDAMLPADAVLRNQANTYSGGGLQDFSAMNWKIPTAGGFTAGATQMFGYDSTNKNPHIYDNNADAIVCGFSSAPANGDLVSVSVVSSQVLCTDSGIPTTGGAVFVSNKSDVTNQSTSQTAVTLGGVGFRVQYYASQNALCTTGANSVSFTFNWTDAGGARSLTTGSLVLGSSQAASGYLSGVFPVFINSGNVTYTSTVSGSCASGGPSSYDIHARLERTP